MNWLNYGHWEGLSAAYLPYLYCEIMTSVRERYVIAQDWEIEEYNPANYAGEHIQDFVNGRLPYMQQMLENLCSRWASSPGELMNATTTPSDRFYSALDKTSWPGGWLSPEYLTDVRPWIQARQFVCCLLYAQRNVWGRCDGYCEWRDELESIPRSYPQVYPTLQKGWEYMLDGEEHKEWGLVPNILLLKNIVQYKSSFAASHIARNGGQSYTKFINKIDLTNEPTVGDVVKWKHGDYTGDIAVACGSGGYWGYNIYKPYLVAPVTLRAKDTQDNTFVAEIGADGVVTSFTFNGDELSLNAHNKYHLPDFTTPLPRGGYFEYGYELTTELPESTYWEMDIDTWNNYSGWGSMGIGMTWSNLQYVLGLSSLDFTYG